ncbi:LysR substrate-binding domain-containing protein [uncultured Aquitalea sp.]|uniref:LysR substrate-binding domain-containing protein n=1 Tax=uncultured Aquitalea sp. TaxID=540272 RepID=UPI0025E5FFA0|nr:LysR substrate-binding domain-containing protein [uncultured Aquitalea sp.]
MSRYLKNLPPLDTLIHFEAVLRNGSFTKAATELCVTQSAVSKQVRALEDWLKLPLFERQVRGITPTPAGHALYRELQPLLQGLLRGVARLQAEHNRHTLTVNCTHAVAQFWLFPRLVAFSQQHPDITVNIHASNSMDEASVAEYDFAVFYGDGGWSSLAAEPLFAEEVYPVHSARLQYPDIAAPEELAALPLIQLDSSAWNCINWHDWFAHFGREYTPPERAVMFNQVTLAFNAVLQGMGIGLGWAFMCEDLLAQGALRRLGPYAFVSGKQDFLVHPKHKTLSDNARLFKNWLLESVSQASAPPGSPALLAY